VTKWLASLVLSLSMLGCGNQAPASPSGTPMATLEPRDSCHLTDGTTAAAGAVAPADDGCNTCTCGPTGWSCTEIACPRHG